MAHIALAVSDQARSRRFYETYFEFDPETAWVAEDGALLIEGPGDVTLALGETSEPISLPAFFHFGFRAARSPEEVRTFRDRLARDGVEIADAQNGAGIVAVQSGSPAAQAGLQANDIITKFNNTTITDSSDLQQAVRAQKPGDTVTLTVDRNGNTMTVKVTLGTNSVSS